MESKNDQVQKALKNLDGIYAAMEAALEGVPVHSFLSDVLKTVQNQTYMMRAKLEVANDLTESIKPL